MSRSPNMTIRIPLGQRAIMEDAAEVTGLTLSDFIRRSALDAASAVLAQMYQADAARRTADAGVDDA
jgi:uncharacterized protein (DUF1778 family)